MLDLDWVLLELARRAYRPASASAAPIWERRAGPRPSTGTRVVLAERAAMTPGLASAEFAAPVGWHRAAARDAGHRDDRPACRRADRVAGG